MPRSASLPLLGARLGVALVASQLSACASSDPIMLPPLAEVVVAVDTDAPVPELVSRLRVDFFDQAGTWLDSRDILRADARDWPATFSVHSDDQVHEKKLILRIRGYQDGRLRRYEGEQLGPTQPFVEPHAPQSLAELCESLPELRLGEPLTLRRGQRNFTGYVPTDSCQRQSARGGALAANLRIEKSGRYRIETVRSVPFGGTAGDALLIVRQRCAEQATQIACNDEASGDLTLDNFDHLARLEVQLAPGAYAVLVVGLQAAPADVTLKADLAASWQDAEPASLTPSPALPRLVRDGVDITPAEEPQPLVSIDRLVRLRLVPGEKRLARVTLKTQCTGTMARLSASGSFANLVPSEAETCLEREGERQPLMDEALEPFVSFPSRSSVGRFGLDEPCAPAEGASAAVCIPGGQFVFGMPTVASSVGRFAVMHRFWMDRTEVTVERWRSAVARGLTPRDVTPIANDARYATSVTASLPSTCTYSTNPLPDPYNRERFPVNCLTWYDARDFCAFEGGELPSEAQWEYAASRAGRPRSGRFPWLAETDGAIGCEQAVFARSDDATDATPSSICRNLGFGVASVDDPAYQNDATPLGVLGLGGSLAEWMLDAWARSLDDDCWRNATLTSPLCWQNEAPVRSFRGGSAFGAASDLLVGGRAAAEPLGDSAIGFLNLGFRCVYAEPP